jgi:hypothetical protein
MSHHSNTGYMYAHALIKNVWTVFCIKKSSITEEDSYIPVCHQSGMHHRVHPGQEFAVRNYIKLWVVMEWQKYCWTELLLAVNGKKAKRSLRQTGIHFKYSQCFNKVSNDMYRTTYILYLQFHEQMRIYKVWSSISYNGCKLVQSDELFATNLKTDVTFKSDKHISAVIFF